MKHLLAVIILIALAGVMVGCGTSATDRWGYPLYCGGIDADGDGVISGAFDVGGDFTTDNIAVGTAVMLAGDNATVVTHGLGGVPDFIYLTWASDPGNDPALFWDSADATQFTIHATTTNITNTASISWLAVRGDL